MIEGNNKQVNEEIYNCLNLENPRSFFLFAGAGSGKTRTLVEVLEKFREQNLQSLRTNGHKIAIITYTNAASDEIKRRLDFDPAFVISTIHSFAWELISPYTNDIKEWLRDLLQKEIKELEEAQSKGRAGTKAATDRPKQIASKQKRLNALDSIRKFTYSPNGDNSSRESLNHAEVIGLAADFLRKPLMQKILVRKYPILLIDESQDTKKDLIEAFFNVQRNHSDCFCLGMFGDTMQRIYTDGKIDLGLDIPDSWAKPAKTVNYRCPKRVITLINKIRSGADKQSQEAAKTDMDGTVRLFIADTTRPFDKTLFENSVSKKMAEITGDENWNGAKDEVKVLTLEHHMAAKRGGFSTFFDPLYVVDRLKTGLLDGTLSGVSLFANQVLPLVNALQSGDQFTAMKIVRKYSPLLKKETLKSSHNPLAETLKVNLAVNTLLTLWNYGDIPSLNDILKEVYRSGLFQVPDSLVPIAERLNMQSGIPITAPGDDSERDEFIDAWDDALKCNFKQFENYVSYISDQSRFGTHQGIKGLEFPRVMVILDDEEARGFLFSYDKLFGAKEPTPTDKKNQLEGKETSIDKTRRLFYVTCSRAEKSLAIIAYTKEPKKVKNHAISNGWFESSEIIVDD